MHAPKVTLAVIARDEESNIADLIRSFQKAVDEIVIVDTGSTDRTTEIAQNMGAKVYRYTWNDDFAAARQFSFDMCQTEFILWADCDDRLCEGGEQGIKQLLAANKSDIYFMQWQIGHDRAWRERMVRRGSGRWERKIHENFKFNPGSRISYVQGMHIEHPSTHLKKKSHERNRRILTELTKESGLDIFYLATEHFRNNDLKLAMKYAQAALQLLSDINYKYELLFLMALASNAKADRIKYALSAYSLCPYRRETIILLCQDALKNREDKIAIAYAQAYYGIPLPDFEFFGIQREWYGWKGADLLCKCLRRNGRHQEADTLEHKMRNNCLPLITLVHATRGRPEKMIECRNLWMSRAHDPAMVQHVFVIDDDDCEEVHQAANDFVFLTVPPGGGCVRAWNDGAEKSSGTVIVQLSDDWIPPHNWDKIIVERLGDKLHDQAVLAVSDGIIREDGQMTKCLCMAILTRERWLYQGHMFHPNYLSVYSDNEFTERAYQDGVVIEARDVIFEHTHFITGKSKEDQTYRDQNAPERYQKGQEVFNARRQPKTQLNRSYAAFILATKDDFCLEAVCQRLIEEGVTSLWFGIPMTYWNGKENSRENADEVKAIAAKFPKSNVVMLDVEQFRDPDRHILITEAMVRNQMLEMMRRQLHQHIIVADGDELWTPGSLLKLDRYIDDNNPTSVAMRMIPVAGLPGYPIAYARDVAMVYLGPGTKFSQCRSSEGEQKIFSHRGIIHFTATRKTMDEIIQKHRESGHYTDPDYDFEGWIKNILPNIKPGMRDVHMFRKWSTWPVVRHWTQVEWEILPESIKQYLGEPEFQSFPYPI